MRFTQLTKTTFQNVAMRETFWVATVPDPSKMAELVKHKKTRLRARKLPTVQADPHSLITVAENEKGVPVFFAADDPVWIAKQPEGNSNASKGSDDSGNSQDDEGTAAE